MASFDELVPEHIRALARYSPGKHVREAERESGVHCIKLASNENPFGPSPRAVEAMRAAAAESNFYPDNESSDLRLRLAERHAISPQHILVTDGTTAFIDILARTFLGPGLAAISCQLSFIVYRIATTAAGGRFVTVPTREHGFDLEAIAGAVDDSTRLIFLANPNNPTGTMFDASATDRFLERIPERVMVVLDEAYADFAEDFARRRGIAYSHSLDYVRQGRNVVVLRTFSKAHGLAGIRVGYGFAAPELLRYLSRVRTAFSVSNVAEAAALAALEDAPHVRRAVENNAVQAEWLAAELAQMGIRAVPTSANFLYFETAEDAAALAGRIQGEGVIVRPLGAWGAPRAIRVTVGTPEQNTRFIAVLRKVLAGAAVR